MAIKKIEELPDWQFPGPTERSKFCRDQVKEFYYSDFDIAEVTG